MIITESNENHKAVLPPPEACTICDELAARGQTMLSRALRDPNISNAVLDYTDHLAVIPSVGPIVRDHSLIVTRAHASSLLANLDADLADELCSLTRRFIEGHGGGERSVLCFEHASLHACKPKKICTTSHAHLHLVPLAIGVVSEVMMNLAALPGALKTALSVDLPYPAEYVAAFIGTGTVESSIVLVGAENLPSQFLRQEISAALGSDSWDWRAFTNREFLSDACAESAFVNLDVHI